MSNSDMNDFYFPFLFFYSLFPSFFFYFPLLSLFRSPLPFLAFLLYYSLTEIQDAVACKKPCDILKKCSPSCSYSMR